MKQRKTWGIILLIIGIVFYLFGSYIEGEVAKGRKQISSAQSTVDTGRKVSKLNPVTGVAGEMFAGSAQKKIDEGRRKADTYEVIADWLHGIGIVLIIVGALLFILGFFGRKPSKK